MAVPARVNSNAEVLSDTDEFGFDDGSDNKLGDLTEDGITFAVSTEENELRSGSQREIYAYLRGPVSQMWSGALLNVNVNNYAFALGMSEAAANITGAGTAGDPYIFTIDPTKFGEQAARTYYAKGTRINGDVIRGEASARVFAPDIEWTMAQGEATAVPFALRVSGTWEIHQYTP